VLSSSGSRFLDQYTEQFRDRPDLARRSRTQALARTNVRSIGGRPLCSNPSVSEGSMRSIAAVPVSIGRSAVLGRLPSPGGEQTSPAISLGQSTPNAVSSAIDS